MSADRIALSGRLRAELIDLERVAERAVHLLARAKARNDADYLDGVALNLHGFYAGTEHLFEEIARELDRSVPSGPEWPRDLLLQMAAELPNLRPPVITRDTRDCLDEYRGFRHIVRNVYTFNLRPSRLAELVDGLRACYEVLARDITDFAEFLESQDVEP
jgi:hypothetical protein